MVSCITDICPVTMENSAAADPWDGGSATASNSVKGFS